MAEGDGEIRWDLSNSVMAAVVNSSRNLAATLVSVNGGKPKHQKPLDPREINPYRR